MAEKIVDMIIIFDHGISLAYFEKWTCLNDTSSNWLIRKKKVKFTTMQALTQLKHDVSHTGVQYYRDWHGFCSRNLNRLLCLT